MKKKQTKWCVCDASNCVGLSVDAEQQQEICKSHMLWTVDVSGRRCNCSSNAVLRMSGVWVLASLPCVLHLPLLLQLYLQYTHVDACHDNGDWKFGIPVFSSTHTANISARCNKLLD